MIVGTGITMRNNIDDVILDEEFCTMTVATRGDQNYIGSSTTMAADERAMKAIIHNSSARD